MSTQSDVEMQYLKCLCADSTNPLDTIMELLNCLLSEGVDGVL